MSKLSRINHAAQMQALSMTPNLHQQRPSPATPASTAWTSEGQTQLDSCARPYSLERPTPPLQMTIIIWRQRRSILRRKRKLSALRRQVSMRLSPPTSLIKCSQKKQRRQKKTMHLLRAR